MRRISILLLALSSIAFVACGGGDSDTPTPDNGTVDPDSIATLAPEDGVTKQQLGEGIAAKLEEGRVAQDCGLAALTDAAANGAFSRPDILTWAEGNADDELRRAIEDALSVAGC